MNNGGALTYLEALASLGIRVGLDHTRHLARRLGDPQDSYPCVLIGGTNGKGSTASFLAAILQSAGNRVGLYTSPHLLDIRERFLVNGAQPTEDEFEGAVDRVRAEAEQAVDRGELGAPPTYFETLTLAAFHHFHEAQVDIAVLEVGLGGRLDCTNIVSPLASVITTIGKDHEDVLGGGLENIAREKAGILRPGVPAFTGAAQGPGLDTLRACALALGAPLKELAQYTLAESAEGWSLSCDGRLLRLPMPSLAGRHQIRNAALAILAALSLGKPEFHITDETLREGLAAARWPGRLEIIGRHPDVYLDGAHNPEGCQALAEFLSARPPGRRALVFTALRDKPAGEMLSILAPHFEAIWITTVPMERCPPAKDIAASLPPRGARVTPDPEAAFREAAAWAGVEGTVVVAGSLYLVGFIKALGEGGVSKSWGSGL